ncbi:hypothetical protein MMPV_004134 [Pyropia vietnamensis]
MMSDDQETRVSLDGTTSGDGSDCSCASQLQGSAGGTAATDAAAVASAAVTQRGDLHYHLDGSLRALPPTTMDADSLPVGGPVDLPLPPPADAMQLPEAPAAAGPMLPQPPPASAMLPPDVLAAAAATAAAAAVAAPASPPGGTAGTTTTTTGHRGGGADGAASPRPAVDTWSAGSAGAPHPPPPPPDIVLSAGGGDSLSDLHVVESIKHSDGPPIKPRRLRLPLGRGAPPLKGPPAASDGWWVVARLRSTRWVSVGTSWLLPDGAFLVWRVAFFLATSTGLGVLIIGASPLERSGLASTVVTDALTVQLTAAFLLLVPPIARAVTGPHEDELDGTRSARTLWALGAIFAQLVVTNAFFVVVVLTTLSALLPHLRVVETLAPDGAVVGGWRVAAALTVGGGAAFAELVLDNVPYRLGVVALGEAILLGYLLLSMVGVGAPAVLTDGSLLGGRLDVGKLAALAMGMGAWYAGCGVVAMGAQRARSAVAARLERYKYNKEVLGAGGGGGYVGDYA